MKKKHYLFGSLLLAVFLLTSCNKKTKNNIVKTKPNIIYILADDLGYGDLSSYGQTKFTTPNIDKLAKEGLLFTQHYAGSTVCAPSRSALMTGLHTGHTPIRGNKRLELPKESLTIAEVLKENGYKTGAFGKWGLGSANQEGSPMRQGFDAFYGYLDQRLAHHYYPNHLWENDQKIILEENQGLEKGQYAPNLIHKKALTFIENHKSEPFFLYYPSIIPHAELFAPVAYLNRFKGKFNPEKSYKGVDDGDLYKEGRYGSQENSHAAFVAMITLLDDQVGELVQKVKDLGLEENTIFIFTSDNGPHKEAGADPNYFDSNGILKGVKRDLFEGGIRVPMIAKWKGKIKEGTTTDHISAFWDVFSTFSEITENKKPIQVDGISFLPTLLGENLKQEKHDYLYWEFHELQGRQAIRKDNWKLVKYNVKTKEKFFLYDLKSDPSESNNLADKQPEKLKELKEILENTRTASENFKF
ncbi:arylsulfatase [Polaribacter litorisediminis]|uniref:arylsulfatase n=1 Tax=Polaribacter litorisediminis TaxID=1908341 RepID=UPI001CBF41AE|nr:arylsulfatase [Polaribacter litorisediminis]UAM97980.1 arylsulfatase [Polaribacter litorisediminis]